MVKVNKQVIPVLLFGLGYALPVLFMVLTNLRFDGYEEQCFVDNRLMVNYTCLVGYPVNATINGVNKTIIEHKSFGNLTYSQVGELINQVNNYGSNYTVNCSSDEPITCLQKVLVRNVTVVS